MPLMHFRAVIRIWTFVIACFSFLVCSGQTSGRLLKEADNLYENQRYRAALRYYKEGGNEQTWDKDTRLRVAVCMYEINNVAGARAILDQLDREVNTPAEVFFYLARVHQANEAFDEAIVNYKAFLREAKNNDPKRPWVKDEILRCASANSMKYSEQIAYVENLGTSLNTFYDEFGPIPSPLYPDRLYFSSARDGSKGGLKDPRNIDDLKYGTYRSDMYYSENQNGIWRAAKGLGALNSTRHDIIYGFSSDGQRLFYFSGEDPLRGQLVVDTFKADVKDELSATRLGPFDPEMGDRDLFLFNDTTILFSSRRAGGLGGYDLYFSVLRNGAWTDATNMGESVNSFYEDVSPFLSRNGRELYFSSNRLSSTGGLDIFRCVFDDTTVTWSEPINMGFPINSPGDDAYFFVSGDGLTAYFSSNRKSGYGSRDIYAAYMKETVESHLTVRDPSSFIQIQAQRVGDAVATTGGSSEIRKVKEYFIGDLLFGEDDVVLTPQNLKKLEIIANILLIYPTLTMDVICHDVSTGPTSFDLYFSIKKSEQVTEYLMRKGIDGNRLFIKGCGAFYPRTRKMDITAVNPNIDRLNRRIEINIYGAEDLPISILHESPNVPEEALVEHTIAYREMHEGVAFRVQIASVSQMFQHSILDGVEDAMIQWDPTTQTYKYFVGLSENYEEARTLRDDLRTRGFGDCFVVAHLNGKLVTQTDVSLHSGDYPELLNLKSGD